MLGESVERQRMLAVRGGLAGRHATGYFFVLIAIALMLVPVPASADSPTVLISNYTITPAVLMPGDTGTITVILTNTATAATETRTDLQNLPNGGQQTITTSTQLNAYVESVILRTEDLRVLSGSYQRVGEIGPGQSFPLTFLFRAPSREGIFFPEIWVRVAGGTSVRYPIPVNVNSQFALIKRPSIRVERTVPARVDPGDTFNVTLFLFNEGQSSANDISINVNATAGSITPRTSENYYIPMLRPGEERILNLSFETDRGSAVGLSPVLVTINYLNTDQSTFRQVSTIGIPIVGRAALSVASVRTDPARISVGDPVDLTIRIENTGTADANSVQATINDMPLPGTKEAFLGTIEPNNDAPAVFSLQADRQGEFSYTITIRYTDDYGTHSTQQILRLIVTERSPTGAIIAAIVILVIVAAIAVLWYRRRQES
jgi:uncharacterized repeat protein (TIGR01451 family)